MTGNLRSGIGVGLIMLLCGCNGTPPPTPVAKTVTLKGKAQWDDPKPIHFVVEYLDGSGNWTTDVAVTIDWPDENERDQEGYLHVEHTIPLLTGRHYRFSSCDYTLDPITGQPVITNIGTSHEPAGLYDGVQTTFDAGNIAGM